MRWLLLVAALACSKSSQQEPPAPANQVPAMSAAEVQRSRDACEDYVTRACACAKSVPEAKGQCDLARSLPDAVRIGVQVAGNPETSPKDALDAQRNVRKAVAECIEETAKLPTLGCP